MTFVKEEIGIDECPELFKTEVTSYVTLHEQSRLLCVEKITSTPYKDKTIIDTSYLAYLNWGNLFTVKRFTVSSNERFTDLKVREGSMIASEISKFVELEREWFGQFEKKY